MKTIRYIFFSILHFFSIGNFYIAEIDILENLMITTYKIEGYSFRNPNKTVEKCLIKAFGDLWFIIAKYKITKIW